MFISLFAAYSDQQSLSTIADMVTPASTRLHSTFMDHNCQLSPRDVAEADINNTISPQFGHVMDINSSSWEHLHHLGTCFNLIQV